MMSQWRTFGVLLGAMLAVALSWRTAQSAETCVVCQEPAATYLCQGQAAPEHQAFLGNARLIQLACIKNIAKAYGHASCKAGQAHAGACNAPVVIVDITEMAREHANRIPAPLKPKDNSQFQPAHKPPAPSDGEPKTVVELAKRTAEATKRQLQKAGDAVKKAGKNMSDGAKQTWRCLSSLFADC